MGRVAGALAVLIPSTIPPACNVHPNRLGHMSGSEGDLHSFSKRWNCMPSRPTDLQKVYVEELFFFGQSFRICSREGEGHALMVHTCVRALGCMNTQGHWGTHKYIQRNVSTLAQLYT